MEAFTKDSVVPEIVDSVPPSCLKVTFGEVELTPGNPLTPTQVKDKPTIAYDAEPDVFYTLIFIDHDVPSRKDPKLADILHWLVVNIKGNNVASGKEVAQYIGSGAPKGSGLHRYCMFVYKQTNGEIDINQLQLIPNTTVEGRRCFKAGEFAKKYGLELAAGNFFQAEWDDYVPILHKQLGFTPQPDPASTE